MRVRAEALEGAISFKNKSKVKSHLVHLLCEGFVLLCCRWVDFRDSEMFINKFWFIVFKNTLVDDIATVNSEIFARILFSRVV